MSSTKEIKCEHCAFINNVKPKKTLLGFLKFDCLSCKKNNLLPLTAGHRVAYWIIFIFFALATLGGISEGIVVLPGLILVLFGYALYKDTKVRKLRA